MAWESIDRCTPVIEKDAKPVLSDAVCDKIRSFFPRYETKRAALLPALHVTQDALGHVDWQAMREIAELLELKPSEVFDTVSFYTHFWTHDKGKKVITLCRSLSCQLMGADAVKEAIESQLKITEHETTADHAYSFATEECLATCDFAPCLLVNERLHKNVKPGDVANLIADPNNDKLPFPRSTLYDAPQPAADTAAIGKTSDVSEMKDS